MDMKKIANAVIVKSVRELIDTMNEWSILKEDIVTILKEEDKYILIYYSDLDE